MILSRSLLVWPVLTRSRMAAFEVITEALVAPTVSTSESPRAELAKVAESSTPSDEHFKFADTTHDYVREYIRNADQKASFFFAAATAGLGYLLAKHVVRGWVDAATFTVADYASMIAVAGLTAAAALFLSVVFPRLRSSSPGLIFFNEIAAHSSALNYSKSALATSSAELARSKLRHLHDLAKVCRRKYELLRLGFWTGAVGGLAALMYLALRASDAL